METELEDFSDQLHDEECQKALQSILTTLATLERSDKIRIISCAEQFYALDVNEEAPH